jgi:hypothetical protein
MSNLLEERRVPSELGILNNSGASSEETQISPITAFGEK